MRTFAGRELRLHVRECSHSCRDSSSRRLGRNRPRNVSADRSPDSCTRTTLLRQLRADKHRLPVLVLTARSTVADKVDGLDSGADDFLTKPFDITELFARVRALLRRRGDHKATLLLAVGISLDPVDRQVIFEGESVDLTAREFALLEILLRNAGRYVSRARLEEGIYSWGEEVESNTVEVYVSRLRKRFGSSCIETMRGVGYRVPA